MISFSRSRTKALQVGGSIIVDMCLIDTTCTTDPKELNPHRWVVRFKGTSDVTDAKFVDKSFSRIPPSSPKNGLSDEPHNRLPPYDQDSKSVTTARIPDPYGPNQPMSPIRVSTLMHSRRIVFQRMPWLMMFSSRENTLRASRPCRTASCGLHSLCR